MSAFIHPLSDGQSKDIGEGTRIWQYCVVLPGAKIGKNCNICSHCFIENDVVIGDNVTIKCGVQIWDGMRIEDNVFIGPNATFCNDRHPVSRTKEWYLEKVIVHRAAMVGAGAIILPGIEIGEYAQIGAGSIVTKNIAPHAIIISRRL